MRVPADADAEEAERLEVPLLFEQAVCPAATGRLALALGWRCRAYSRRAPAVIDRLAQLARAGGKRIPLRLVKGRITGMANQAGPAGRLRPVIRC